MSACAAGDQVIGVYYCDVAGDPRVLRLIDAYRDHGHLKARLDPLGIVNPSEPEGYSLDPQVFGLSDNEGVFSVSECLLAFPHPQGSLPEVIQHLQHMYCGNISLQAAHVSVSKYILYLQHMY